MAFRLIDRTIEAVAVACLVASSGMICTNIFYRYAVLDWLREWAEGADWIVPLYRLADGMLGAISVTADEVPGYLLVWIAFLGAYLAMRQDGHIGFDALIDRLPRRAGNALRFAIDVAIVAFLAVLFWQSIRMIRVDGATDIETAAISQGWFMAVLPAAALLLVAAVAERAGARMRKSRRAR